MTPSSETGSPIPSGLGTGRMTVVLGLALVANFGLLLAPLFFGSSSDSAVAANLDAPTLPAPAAQKGAPAIRPADKSATQPQPEAVVESPLIETYVGDERPEPVEVAQPVTGDPIDRVESPAPAEIPGTANPATALASGSGIDDPPQAVVLDIPVDVSPVTLPLPMPDFDPCILEIVNPLETNGPVHFVIEGAVHTLLPGETRQWLALGQRNVEFHRGDEFGDATYVVERGTWQFQVSEAGWELVAAEHVSMTFPAPAP